MKRFQFTEDEYSKLADMTGIPMMDLVRLDSMGLLVNDVAVKMIMDYEFRMARRATKAIPKLIIQAIALKYGMSPSSVRRFLCTTTPKAHYCEKCKRELTKAERFRNKTICDDCAAKEIEL